METNVMSEDTFKWKFWTSVTHYVQENFFFLSNEEKLNMTDKDNDKKFH